jgi:hypothetical protein
MRFRKHHTSRQVTALEGAVRQIRSLQVANSHQAALIVELQPLCWRRLGVELDVMNSRNREIAAMPYRELMDASGVLPSDSRGEGTTKLTQWITTQVILAGLNAKIEGPAVGREPVFTCSQCGKQVAPTSTPPGTSTAWTDVDRGSVYCHGIVGALTAHRPVGSPR